MRRRQDGEQRELPHSLRLAIGRELRHVRQDQKKRLEDVADACKTDAGNISRIETAKQNISLPMLHEMSNALGRKMWQILQVAEGAQLPSSERFTATERAIILAVREKKPDAALGAVYRALSEDGSFAFVDTDEPSQKHFGESSRGRSRSARKEKGKPKRRKGASGSAA